MATTTTTPVPVPAPNVPSAGVTVNPAINIATHALVLLGGVTAALGFTHAHDMIDAVTNSQFLTGVIGSGFAFLISHFIVAGSNSNTLQLADDGLVALTQLVHSLAAKQAPAPTPPAGQA